MKLKVKRKMKMDVRVKMQMQYLDGTLGGDSFTSVSGDRVKGVDFGIFFFFAFFSSSSLSVSLAS